MQATIYNLKGESLETVELNDAIYGIEPNIAVVHQAVLRQQANARLGTHNTLTRADVRKQLGVSLKSITGSKYTETHQIGNWAKANGYDGILAPSARNPTGSNLISFAGF